ncbi:cupin domain-containing protein [Streptomyces sp. FR-108]|uniref:cupin domain-containing protein n=1 Tax=Streptomyces sp. FR-108 TaxID=3416665 RepID=UPI003CF6EA19
MQDGTAPRGTPADLSATAESLLPGPGGSGMTMVRFPPSSVFASVDVTAADEEQRQALPGLAQRFDPERPGFHTTPTVDYVIVLEGELWLELDHGSETLLRKGDVVIQNGTPHAWHNRTSQPATIAAVSVGTHPVSD